MAKPALSPPTTMRQITAVEAPVARQHTTHGLERKQQLLDVAARLFAAGGYASTRIEDICREAGVAKGLFYWYFPTKRDLFNELVRTMRRRLRRAQADAMDPAADPLTRIRQGSEATVRFTAEHAPYFSFLDIERAAPDHNRAPVMREGTELAIGDTLRLVVEAQSGGLVPEEDPRLLTHGVLGAVSGLANAYRHGRVDIDLDEFAVFVGRWVERALRQRP